MNKTSQLTVLLLASAALLLPSCAYHAPSKHVVHNHTVVTKPVVKKQIVVKSPAVVKQKVAKKGVKSSYHSRYKKAAVTLKQPRVSQKSLFSKYERRVIVNKKVADKKTVTKRGINSKRVNYKTTAGNKRKEAQNNKSQRNHQRRMASRD